MTTNGSHKHMSKRRLIHPIKAALRAKIQELRDNGVDLTGLSHTHKTVFLCLKHDLPYVDEIIGYLKQGNWQETELWKLFFRSEFRTLDEVQTAYAHYKETVPLAMPYVRRGHDIKYTYWEHKWRIDAIRENLPEGPHPDITVLHAAATLHIELHSNAQRQANIYQSPVSVSRHNINDVLFTAAHLDEIEKHKESFLDLGLWSEWQIAPALEAGNVTLAAGVL